jgi:hypothetical protein
VTSQGETLEEAQANIKEAIELYIESFGEDLPREILKTCSEKGRICRGSIEGEPCIASKDHFRNNLQDCYSIA